MRFPDVEVQLSDWLKARCRPGRAKSEPLVRARERSPSAADNPVAVAQLLPGALQSLARCRCLHWPLSWVAGTALCMLAISAWCPAWRQCLHSLRTFCKTAGLTLSACSSMFACFSNRFSSSGPRFSGVRNNGFDAFACMQGQRQVKLNPAAVLPQATFEEAAICRGSHGRFVCLTYLPCWVTPQHIGALFQDFLLGSDQYKCARRGRQSALLAQQTLYGCDRALRIAALRCVECCHQCCLPQAGAALADVHRARWPCSPCAPTLLRSVPVAMLLQLPNDARMLCHLATFERSMDCVQHVCVKHRTKVNETGTCAIHNFGICILAAANDSIVCMQHPRQAAQQGGRKRHICHCAIG